MLEDNPNLENQQEYIKKALINFDLALELDPESASLHTNYGILLAQNEDWHFAKMAFREALRIDPKNKLAKQNLNDVEMLVGQASNMGAASDLQPRHRPLMKRHIGPTPKIH